MLEEINFQNLGITGRIEHKMDLFVKIQIAEKLFHEKQSTHLITGIFLGNIEGEVVNIHKVLFFPIFDFNDDQLHFHREGVVSMIDFHKKIYDLQVVGWFINNELQDMVPTMHFLLNEFRSSQFILITGKLDLDQKDLFLEGY